MLGKRTRKGDKFCELGTGVLDLKGVLKVLKDINYDGWIMNGTTECRITCKTRRTCEQC